MHSEHLLGAVLATRSVRADGWALPGGRAGVGLGRGRKHDRKKDELMAPCTFNVIVSLCLCLSQSFPPKLNMGNLFLFFRVPSRMA